jgi:uncharacterized integral membrane protein
MRRFLKALILLPVAILVVLLAVANRAPVELNLDPLSGGSSPEFAVTLPLYAVLFGAVALGIVIGGMGAWFAQGRHRRAERRYKREAGRLRGEAERLRTRPQGPSVPALAGPAR